MKFEVQSVEIHHLYNFYKDLLQIVDMVILNEKQKAAVINQIVLLLNRYFAFELPDGDDFCLDMNDFEKRANEIRKTMK